MEGLSYPLRLEDGERYPVVELGSDGFKGFSSPNHPYLIARINGEDGSEWYVTKAEKPLEGLELYQHSKLLSATLTPRWAETLTFPKVDFEKKVDQELCVGLTTTDDQGASWSIAQCKQQTRIQLNEKGGMAESAAEMAVVFASASSRMPVSITIDGPFVIWIIQRGMKLPLVVAQFSYDSFKDPGDIKFGKPIVG